MYSSFVYPRSAGLFWFLIFMSILFGAFCAIHFNDFLLIVIYLIDLSDE